MASNDRPLSVVHVLDALTDAGPGLWGKERVVAHLLDAQRASGRFDPCLAVFTECSLAELARDRGFPVTVLAEKHRRVPIDATMRLRARLSGADSMLVHSHEYKANVVARALRRTGTPMLALVSTSHAWFDDSRTLALYNAVDRITAAASDLVTVADRHMTLLFPRAVRAEFVANGVPDRSPATAASRAEARSRFGFPEDLFVAGFLARTSIAKGVGVFCDAARASAGDALWTVAGSGDREDLARDANLANLRFLGFERDTDAYRSAIDCYVQASFVEGLSLSLLEAMRAGLPIVATDAGSTRLAIRDGVDGIVVPPGDPGAISSAVAKLAADESRRRSLGASARARFVSHFSIERQVEVFAELYAAAIARRSKAA